MNIYGIPYTSIWYESQTDQVFYIDQVQLPWNFVIREMKAFEDGIRAIAGMEVRGAPLIGVAAALAMYVGFRESLPGLLLRKGREDESVEEFLRSMADRLIATRPTAVNLAVAVNKMLEMSLVTRHLSPSSRFTFHATRLLQTALSIREAELNYSRLIGAHGLPLIQEIAALKGGEPVNILTHCNAGWLATVDYGTALAPVYLAHDSGIPVHIWVDETRPRNQGAKLTVYELSRHGVPNTLIVDNAGGQLMQQGMVDMVIVGADRITANGDVVNKIGTYLKALAAFDNRVPFYVAAPSTTFDKDTPTGRDVPIEERSPDEVLLIDSGTRIAPAGTPVRNPGFDVTPARLVTGYITESPCRI